MSSILSPNKHLKKWPSMPRSKSGSMMVSQRNCKTSSLPPSLMTYDLVNIAIQAEHKMKKLEAKNKRPTPTSVSGSSSRPRAGPPPPPPRSPGAQPPRPMWVVRHPQSPQGQAPRLANAFWNNPSVSTRGPCYNCGGTGHISNHCPSPR
jgi:hypothetical protein